MAFPTIDSQGSGHHKKLSPIRLTGDPVEDERKLRLYYWRAFIQTLKGGDIDSAVRLVTHGKVRPGYASRIREECPLVLAASLGNEAVVVALLDKGFGAGHARSLLSAEQQQQQQLLPHQRQAKPHRPSRGMSQARARAPSTFRIGSMPVNVLETPAQSKSSTRRKPRKGETTPLHWACYKGSLGTVCALLKFGFDPGCFDSEGNTALHLAATGSHKGPESAHVTILEILLSEGVDPAERNLFGNTALQLATDGRARTLLVRVMRGPLSAQGPGKDEKEKEKKDKSLSSSSSSSSNAANKPETLVLFSLGRIVAAETGLHEVLTTVLQQRREEEELCARGWDLFGAEADAMRSKVTGALCQAQESSGKVGDEVEDSDPNKKQQNDEADLTSNDDEVAEDEDGDMHAQGEQDDSLTDAERAEVQEARRKERTRQARTSVLCAVYERLRQHAQRLSVAVATAKACFVKPKIMLVAEAALRELKARLLCERDMLHVLRGGSEKAHSRLLASIRRGQSQQQSMPAHVVARASRVYLFLEARRRLAASVAQLSDVERSADGTPEQVRALAHNLANFDQHRILFGPGAKRRAKRKLLSQLEAGEGTIADAGHAAVARRGTRTKRGTRTTRKKKSTRKASVAKTKARRADDDDDDDELRALRGNQDDPDGVEHAGQVTNQVTNQGDGNCDDEEEEDDDDVLVRVAEKLLERLQVQVELVWCTNEDVAANHKQGTPGRVRALEGVLLRIETAFERCEALQLKQKAATLAHKSSNDGESATQAGDDDDEEDAHEVVDSEIMANAQVRSKQLTRELKAAKRHFAEKSNVTKNPGAADGGAGKEAAKKKTNNKKPNKRQ